MPVIYKDTALILRIMWRRENAEREDYLPRTTKGRWKKKRRHSKKGTSEKQKNYLKKRIAPLTEKADIFAHVFKPKAV